MKQLKRLGQSFTLISVLAVTAFAGETVTPPCNPGQTESPPCSQSVIDDSTAPVPTVPGQTETPAASTLDLTDIVEAALWTLSLF